METTPNTNELTQEEIVQKVQPILEKYQAEHTSNEYIQSLKAIVKNAASNPECLKDEQALNDFQTALLFLAILDQKDIFTEVYRFSRTKGLDEILPANCWFLRDLHRVFGMLAEADDMGPIADLILDGNVITPVREQAILVFNYLWMEKRFDEKDIIEEHRRMLDKGLPPEDDWKLWVALVIHSAVIGGSKLKPQINAILDSGKLEAQTAFVRKVVNSLFSNSTANIHEVLRKQHKGPFEDVELELKDIFTPFTPEQLEMPEQGKPIRREEPKVGRNDPCPCGSGKKYKKCCGKDK